MPQSGYKSEGGQILGFRKDIALSWNHGAAKCRVEVAVLQHLPRKNLVDVALAVFDVQAVRQRKLNLIRVGQNVPFIKSNDAVEIVDSADILVGDARLNYVFHSLAQPLGGWKHAFERGEN